MNEHGIHASWQHVNGVADLRTACDVAGVDSKGSKKELVERLKKVLPAMGYVATTGLSMRVADDAEGNAVFERICEAGGDVPEEALAISGWWLYRAGKIRVAPPPGANDGVADEDAPVMATGANGGD